MQLKSTKKFDSDYLFLRRMIVSGKVTLKGAKDWISTKGLAAGDRAVLEADHLAKKYARPRTHKEINWKDEVKHLKLEE